MLEERASRQEYEDTEELMQWRSISQDCTNELWKELRGSEEEKVLEKYKVLVGLPALKPGAGLLARKKTGTWPKRECVCAREKGAEHLRVNFRVYVLCMMKPRFMAQCWLWH